MRPIGAVLHGMGALAMLAPSTAAADDHRPSAWLFRATPGWGYAWDRDVMCPAEGMLMTGGWYVGTFVTPSLAVGGGLGLDVVGGRPPRCNLTDDGLLTLAASLGPHVEWYPLDRGLHVRALAGIAHLDQHGRRTGIGVAGTAAVGYDWTWYDEKRHWHDRFGIELELSVLHTVGHTSVMPALTFSVGVD